MNLGASKANTNNPMAACAAERNGMQSNNKRPVPAFLSASPLSMKTFSRKAGSKKITCQRKNNMPLKDDIIPKPRHKVPNVSFRQILLLAAAAAAAAAKTAPKNSLTSADEKHHAAKPRAAAAAASPAAGKYQNCLTCRLSILIVVVVLLEKTVPRAKLKSKKSSCRQEKRPCPWRTSCSSSCSRVKTA